MPPKKKSSPPFPPESVPIKQLRERLSEISDAAVVRALQAADTRSSAVREYERRLDEIAAGETEPAEPNPVVVVDETAPAPTSGTRRAWTNPRIAATTVRIARADYPVEVTDANREQVETARINIGRRQVPLFEIRG